MGLDGLSRRNGHTDGVVERNSFRFYFGVRSRVVGRFRSTCGVARCCREKSQQSCCTQQRSRNQVVANAQGGFLCHLSLTRRFVLCQTRC